MDKPNSLLNYLLYLPFYHYLKLYKSPIDLASNIVRNGTTIRENISSIIIKPVVKILDPTNGLINDVVIPNIENKDRKRHV